jgi:predicted outer membrane repeat protein
VAALALPSPRSAWGAPLAVPPVYDVTSAADLPDADALDGVCLAINGLCTLRAAIMQANHDAGPATVNLPAGVYTLTRVAFDDTALGGDLDISDDLTIQGAGAGVTIVDGNGAVTGDRVFHVLFTASQVTLSGLSIRNGIASTATNPSGLGGGIYRQGNFSDTALLRLSHVAIENNAVLGGGGLFAERSVVTVNDSVLSANTAAGSGGGLGMDGATAASAITLTNTLLEGNAAKDGGGIYASRTYVTLSGVTVHANTASRNGGGFSALEIFLAVHDSTVYGNTADAYGGGIALDDVGSSVIDHTQIYSNTAQNGGGLVTTLFASNRITLLNSTLHHNHAASEGGAVFDANEAMVISRTVIDANSAGTNGGGIVGNAWIQESTLSRNSAAYGGALYAIGDSQTVVNSTLSGNTASHDGGGIYATAFTDIRLFNVTIAGNSVLRPSGQAYPARGGGLFITSTAIITMQNSLIADNVRASGVIQPVPDDCFVAPTTSLRSLGFNLVETTANCTLSGSTVGNILGQDPKLGPLQLNGGATPTRALLAGSPAIDAVHSLIGCTDGALHVLATDQRSFRRPIGAACDMGAFEYSPYALNLPLIMR